MKTCPICGNNVPAQAHFCPACGAKLPASDLELWGLDTGDAPEVLRGLLGGGQTAAHARLADIPMQVLQQEKTRLEQKISRQLDRMQEHADQSHRKLDEIQMNSSAALERLLKQAESRHQQVETDLLDFTQDGGFSLPPERLVEQVWDLFKQIQVMLRTMSTIQKSLNIQTVYLLSETADLLPTLQGDFRKIQVLQGLLEIKDCFSVLAGPVVPDPLREIELQELIPMVVRSIREGVFSLQAFDAIRSGMKPAEAASPPAAPPGLAAPAQPAPAPAKKQEKAITQPFDLEEIQQSLKARKYHYRAPNKGLSPKMRRLLKELESAAVQGAETGPPTNMFEGVSPADLEREAGSSLTDGATGGEIPTLPSPHAVQRVSREPGADPVDCTVMSPAEVGAGCPFLVQVLLHTCEQAEAARAMAMEFDRDSRRLGYTPLEMDLTFGTKVTVTLSLPPLEVEEPLQMLNWRGRTVSAPFVVRAPEGTKPGTIFGKVTVEVESVPVGLIRFKLKVLEEARIAGALQPAGVEARRYQEAFISYSSQDRNEVLKRVQMLERFHIHVFQDILSLEPGARWQKELYRFIDQCDLFLLFWSSAARKSRWVEKEVRHALKRKGDDESAPPEIIPVVIEGPPVPPPPRYLAHLQFNDRILYYLKPAP